MTSKELLISYIYPDAPTVKYNIYGCGAKRDGKYEHYRIFKRARNSTDCEITNESTVFTKIPSMDKLSEIINTNK